MEASASEQLLEPCTSSTSASTANEHLYRVQMSESEQGAAPSSDAIALPTVQSRGQAVQDTVSIAAPKLLKAFGQSKKRSRSKAVRGWVAFAGKWDVLGSMGLVTTLLSAGELNLLRQFMSHSVTGAVLKDDALSVG